MAIDVSAMDVTTTARNLLTEVSGIHDYEALEIQVDAGSRAVRWWQGVTANFAQATSPYFRQLPGSRWRVVATDGTAVYLWVPRGSSRVAVRTLPRDASGQPIA